ncbi:MAG: glycosyltransferase [Methanocella sp.]
METLRFLFTSSFYPPYHIGGDAVHVKYLAEELAKLGHEVHVLHSIDAYRVKRKNPINENKPSSIHTHPIKTRFNNTAYGAYFFGHSSTVTSKFKELTNTLKPDIVHHHNISLLGYELLFKEKNYFNLFTAHDFWLICQQNNLLKKSGKICEKKACFSCCIAYRRPPQVWRQSAKIKKALSKIDLLISPSQFTHSVLTKNVGFNKAIVIPNFAPKPPEIIESSGFSSFFTYVGALEKHKGILELVKFFGEKSLDLNLVIAGDGRLANEIRRYLRRNSLEKRIVLLGWVDHDSLYSLLTDANALFMPSICAENAPLAMLEALSVGTPVIASNVGGLPEILQHVDQGLIYKDAASLERLLYDFSKDKYSQTKLKTVFNRNFSPQAYLNEYLKILKDLTMG